jgi:putative transcriptional regulator
MEKNIPTFLKGHFLMAFPTLEDPNFQSSVTCISEHNAEGAMGIMVNRLHNDIHLGMIFDELKIEYAPTLEPIPVFSGGPVHVNELFVLHGEPLEGYGGFNINESLALSNSLELLEDIAAGTGPGDYLVALGCAGWAPGQLEWELSQNAWLTCPYDHSIIFNIPVETRWERAVKLLGIDPNLLSDAIGHA